MMGKAAYAYRRCYICNKEFRAAGAAWVSHMRSHARRGEASEYRDGERAAFVYRDKNGKWQKA